MKKSLSVIVLFGLFTFYYLVMELFVNDYAALIVGADKVTILYGICYLLVGLGFPTFFLLRKISNNEIYRRFLYTFSGALSVAAAFAVPFSTSVNFTYVASFVAHFMAGVLGGAVYYCTLMKLRNTGRIGISIGLAYAGANAIQMIGLLFADFFQGPVYDWLEFFALIAAIVLVVIILYLQMPADLTKSEQRKEAKQSGQDSNARNYLVGAIIAMALIAIMHGLLDGIITTLHASEGDYIAYSYPRLFVIPALILAGYLADRKNKAIFSFATLVSMIIILVAVLLFYSPETHNIATSFVYFFGSFMSIYSVVVFMEIAQYSQNPSIVASAGRGVRYFFAGLAIIVMGNLFGTMSNTRLVIIYVIFLVLLFAVFFAMGLQQFSQRPPIAKEKIDFSKYNFTERELDVLNLLFDGKSTVEIAGLLFISERTVRSHISNLLAKSESKTRVEMLLKLK